MARTAALGLLIWALGAAAAEAQSVRSSNLVVTARVSARTSLHVSAEYLRFDLAAPGEPAIASIQFSAGARTRTGGDVILTVESTGAAGDRGLDTHRLQFVGHGEGLAAGDLSEPGPHVAGRWSGSGLRHGTLAFVLRVTSAGVFRIPVRLVLSAP